MKKFVAVFIAAAFIVPVVGSTIAIILDFVK
jgi:hypothetical protein